MNTNTKSPLSAGEQLVLALIKTAFKAVWAVRTTLFWLVFLSAVHGSGSNGWLFWLLVVFLVACAGLGFYRYPILRGVVPVLADVERFMKNRTRKIEVHNGNTVLEKMGLIREDQEFDVRLKETPEAVILTVEKSIAGLSSQKIGDTAKTFKNLFDAESVVVNHLGKGALEVRWLLVNRLDEPFLLSGPPVLDAQTMAVKAVAVEEDGSPLDFAFKEVSGVIVGGQPGSGKTAGVSSFLTPLALSEHVELTIIDGKGGSDWSSYGAVAEQFISVGDDDDVEAAIKVLWDFKAEMDGRLKTLKDKTGYSNYWAVPLQKRPPFKLLVVDECQELFHPTMKDYKKGNALGSEATALITSLVKRGRSAGVCLILITQKLTVDAIPSAVRDQCARAICFRVSTAEAERCVLGPVPDDAGVPRATEIPIERRGGAVIYNEIGTRVMCRFGYLPEKDQERLLNAVAAK